MNLYTQSLADYLIREWDHVITANEATKEVRFIVESVNPECAFEIFKQLEAHRLSYLPSQLECHFRVAKNLWLDWCQRLGESKVKKYFTDVFETDESQLWQWIDQEDRLTKFRNLTQPKDKDGLVIVLLGFNHASDQGGLADFHLLNENRIWQEMGQSFALWLEPLCERLDLGHDSKDIDYFDSTLQQLFKVRPRSLVKLADFLSREVENSSYHFDTLKEVIEQFFENLPYWELPPLLQVNSKKHANIIKEADAFISHQRFKSPSDQKKAWQKLEKAVEDDLLELPFVISSSEDEEPLYEELGDFTTTLRDFIFKADAEAKQKLLRSDLLPVLSILKMRTTASSSAKDKTQRLSGYSCDVFLQAVWMTLHDFISRFDKYEVADVIESIDVVINRFNHDLDQDDAGGLDAQSLAESLLNGCLGGMESWFETVDLRLPQDEDESDLLPDQWQQIIPIRLDRSAVTYGTSRARPHVLFHVVIHSHVESKIKPLQFQWAFSPTHAERVRFQCVQDLLFKFESIGSDSIVLPALVIPDVEMTALYYAADEEEANRLISQALNETKLINLIADLDMAKVDLQLKPELTDLCQAYWQWLNVFAHDGFYTSIGGAFVKLQQAYQLLCEKLLNNAITGSDELLRRFYKAFLIIGKTSKPNDAFLNAAIVWSLSPPVLELTQSRARFLADSFSEVVADHILRDQGDQSFNRLLNLTEIHRPLAGLIIDEQRTLSAKIKSFGFLHYLGLPPSTDKSLAVQTLLREEENEDDEDINDLIRPTEESEIVVRVLNDYLQLYPYAEDGFKILAVHVDDLALILSGIHRFLTRYLKNSSAEWPAFHCELMVYSTSSSPLSMEMRLAAWRDYVLEQQPEKNRPLQLSVGHHFASTRDDIVGLLKKEAGVYDIAFLFHFLAEGLAGETESVLPFQFDFNANNISQFPICEYPRPIRQGDQLKRKCLLSNRRLRTQTRHADLSARLRHPENPKEEHLIYGHVDYSPWQVVIEELHAKAQWVACIDPFIDKRLLVENHFKNERKIVGFTSGLGAFGEINLSVSTELDTLTQLTYMVKDHLAGLLPSILSDRFENIAVQVVREAEEVIGLSSLRAVVGQGEKVREVIGFAAIRLLLPKNLSVSMSQLLPIDSLTHWFADSDVIHRPDLLQLSLVLRKNELPLIQAALIECKFAQQNSTHLYKAIDQLQDGLSHLTQLFAPNRTDIRRVCFDRRYWWAQLQRAITSRSVVNISDNDCKYLDKALEEIAEGYYEIHWQSAAFTFWTDMPETNLKIEKIALPEHIVLPPLNVPSGFFIHHVALGYEGVIQLFENNSGMQQSLAMDNEPIIAKPANGFNDNIGIDQIEPFDSTPVSDSDDESIVKSSFEDSMQTDLPDSAEELTSTSDKLEFTSVSEVREPPIQLTDSVTNATSPEFVSTYDMIDVTSQVSEAKTTVQPADVLKTESSPRAFSSPPDKLLIGTKNNGEPVFWHYGHTDLANRHLLIFGASGYGKTYGIQCLLAEMASLRLRSLIIDYTDGFLPLQVEDEFRDIASPQNYFIIKDKLPLSPFRKQTQLIDPSLPLLEENAYQVATRVTSIFTSVFSSMGVQQQAALIRVLETGLEKDPNFSLDHVLNALREEGTHGVSLANRLEPFIKSDPFRKESGAAWEDMLLSDENWVHVLQLKGLARDIQKLVTEFVLWDLWDYAQNMGNKNRPIPIVLDEIQNLDHRSDSPIDKMLREGRKFGLSMLLATQTISNSKFGPEQQDRLFQAGHKLFFKPADTEVESFARLLSNATEGLTKADWSERLTKLQKGQCWSLGPVLSSNGNLRNKAELVSITPFDKRRFGA